MSRIYAIEENGKKHLVALTCDTCGCRAEIGSDEIKGWAKDGTYYGPGDEKNTEFHRCPDHGR